MCCVNFKESCPSQVRCALKMYINNSDKSLKFFSGTNAKMRDAEYVQERINPRARSSISSGRASFYQVPEQESF